MKLKQKFSVMTAIVVLGLIFMAGTSSLLAQEKTEAKPPVTEKTLYERLGGIYTIAAVVDEFTNRLAADTIVMSNRNVITALGRITIAGLKYHITSMVCSAAGGPERYTGRTMKESHKDLGITGREWDSMVTDFKTTLAKFKVPPKEQAELIAIIGTTKGDIVTAAPKVEEK